MGKRLKQTDIVCFSFMMIRERITVKRGMVALTVCAQLTGTFQIDQWDETLDRILPKSRGTIKVKQQFQVMLALFLILNKLKKGFDSSVMERSWTIVTVIGNGNSLRTSFPAKEMKLIFRFCKENFFISHLSHLHNCCNNTK